MSDGTDWTKLPIARPQFTDVANQTRIDQSRAGSRNRKRGSVAEPMQRAGGRDLTRELKEHAP